MDITNQNGNNNYTLGSGSNTGKDELNYTHEDYNNYQSWSNVGRGQIHMSSVDEVSNVVANKFNFNRLQPLSAPHMSFGDTTLSWAPANNELVQPLEKYMRNGNKNNNKVGNNSKN